MFKGKYLRVLQLEVLKSGKFKIKWISKMYKTGKHRGRRRKVGGEF